LRAERTILGGAVPWITAANSGFDVAHKDGISPPGASAKSLNNLSFTILTTANFFEGVTSFGG